MTYKVTSTTTTEENDHELPPFMFDYIKNQEGRNICIFGMFEKEGIYKIGELDGDITDDELMKYALMRFKHECKWRCCSRWSINN